MHVKGNRGIIIAEPLSPVGGGGSSSLTSEYGDSECAFADIKTDEEQYCEVCGDPAEAHHIRTRGAGGSDDPRNIAWLCHKHHMICHAAGRRTFYEMYKNRLTLEQRQKWEAVCGE